MRWQVAISEFKGDVRLLRDVLKGLSVELVEDEGKYFLASAEFESLHSSGDVRKQAACIESAINEASYDDLTDQVGLKLGSIVVEDTTDGRRLHHNVLMAATAHVQVTLHPVTLSAGASGNLPEEQRRQIEEQLKERDFKRLRRKTLSRAKAAFQDGNGNVRRVQQFLRGDLNIQTLWSIFEIIRADMGDSFKSFAPANQLTRFTRSANHPEVFGDDARHSVNKEPPPPNPMRLDEARQFVREFADRWLERKAGLDESC